MTETVIYSIAALLGSVLSKCCTRSEYEALDGEIRNEIHTFRRFAYHDHYDEGPDDAR